MSHSRRIFLRAAAAAAAGGAGSSLVSAAEPEKKTLPPGRFFADDDFEFPAQIVLGNSYYGAGNPGKLLAIAGQIKNGDFESAYQVYLAAAVEAKRWAQEAAAKSHRVSARDAWLWAANYFSAALRFLDGTEDPSRLLPTFQDYAECWTEAAAQFEPAIERIEIPYESTALTGWLFRVDNSRKRRPLVILNNGADGSELSMYMLGAAGGLARGYNCLTFNGPGQNDSLWLKKLYFRPDWEKVITPVVDWAVKHREVDPKRIALIGASFGGYWAPRALAFEHRIAAGVADPGVWNASEPWFRNLPKFVADMIDQGKKEQFDAALAAGIKMNPRSKVMLDFRTRPFGMASYYDVFRSVRDYNLKDVASQILCPMLITNPESEQFMPGQSPQLYEMLRCPKTLIDFTKEQGAALHCEANAPGYRDFRIYNWLDETLA